MLKSTFSIFMSTWFATAPFFAHAQSAPETVPYEKSQLYKNSTEVTKTSDHREYVEVVARDQNGKETVFQIRKSQEKELRQFSPKALTRDFAENLKKMQPLEAVKATTKRFPMESGLFFMAIGAVTAFQLFTDYSSNPMRMQQHVEHSLSPMGMFSFYMFMSTNGITSNALSTIIKNPKYHSMIPYLGMTAGYFVQSTISTFAADPNVKACVKAMMGQDVSKMEDVSKDPCDAAFSWYALKGKFYELTPGLLSMLGSSYIAFKAQELLVKGVLRITGMDIAFLFLPGGVGVLSVRFLIVSAIQMGLFYYIDVVWLNHFVTFSFKNIFDGDYIARLDWKLTKQLVRKKQTQWADQLPTEICKMQKNAENCDRDFAANLKHMQEQLSNWRMINLTKIYEAHMGWQDMLAKMNSQYDATYSFYRDLVEEIRNSKWKLTSPLRLELVDPLYGVKANGLPEDKSYMYYLKPHFTENQAMETAALVGQSIQQQLDDGSYIAKGFMPYDLRVLKDVAQKLVSNDPIVQGSGVAALNKAYDRMNMDAFAYTIEMIDEMRRISAELGEGARPLMRPGQGFFARYERWSEAADSLKITKFPRISSSFQTSGATDYMAVQAVCGPDASKGESLTAVSFGGAGRFAPPRIVSQQPTNFVCEGLGDLTSDMIFSYPFQDGKETSEGVVGFLKANIRPDILGTRESSGFVPWWENNVEDQLKTKYKEFGKNYEEIVKTLIGQLHTTKNSKFNMGPAPNGVVESIRQQMRLDLMVLGELLKDSFQIQHKQALPAQYFNSKQEPVPGIIASGVKYLKTVPRSTLLRSLRDGSNAPGVIGTQPTQSSIFEFDRLTPLFFPEASTPVLAQARGQALQIQKEIEYEFEMLLWMLRRIKVVQIDGQSRISSDLENHELEAQVQKITDKAEFFGTLLGVGEATDGALVSLPTAEVRDVAINALEDIMALANEVQMYGAISNAVSWDKIRNVEAASESQKEFNSKVQKQVQQLGGSMTRMGGPR